MSHQFFFLGSLAFFLIFSSLELLYPNNLNAFIVKKYFVKPFNRNISRIYNSHMELNQVYEYSIHIILLTDCMNFEINLTLACILFILVKSTQVVRANIMSLRCILKKYCNATILLISSFQM